MASLICFIVLLAASLLYQALGYDIMLNGNALPGQPLEIQMNVGTINTVVSLTKPDGTSAGRCLAPIGGISGGCTAGFSQNLAAGITTYSIASASRTTDEGEWKSSHAADTGNIVIRVLAVPTIPSVTQSVTSLTLSSGTTNAQTLTITVSCAYPAVTLSLSFVPTGGGAAVDAPSSTSTCTSTGSTGCTDANANSYTCVITPQYETTLVPDTYFVQVVVNVDGQYQSIGVNDTITDTLITVEANPVTCDCLICKILLAIGIVVAVLSAVFLWIMYAAVCDTIKLSFLSCFGSELSKTKFQITAIVITVVFVIGAILCIVGLPVCEKCTQDNKFESIGKNLSIVGFVLVVLGLVAVIIISVLIGCGIIKVTKNENTTCRDVPDGQETNIRPIDHKLVGVTSAKSTGSPTSASKIRTRLPNNRVSDSNESDDDNQTPRGKLGLVPLNRKLPPLEKPNDLQPLNLPHRNPSDDSKTANAQEPESTEVKKLKDKKKHKKKNRKQKEEMEQVIDTNDAVYTIPTPLPNQVIESSSHSSDQIRGTVQDSNKPELKDQEADAQLGIEGDA